MASLSEIEDIPFLPPPPGQLSNFDNPESRGPAIIAVCSVFVALMWPIFLLRIYSKAWVTRNFGWDDASSLLAAVGTTSYAACVIWGMKIFGPHGWDVRAIALTEHFIKIEISVFEILYGPSIFFAKLALFLLFLRIFSCNRWTRNAIYFGIVVNLLFYATSTLVFGIQCVRRPGKSWTETTSAERCRKTTRIGYAQGGFGIVSDLYIFILPIPVIWGLQMRLRRKIAVCAIFLTGLIAILASMLGCYYRVLAARSPDLPWTEPPTLGLAVVEMSIGVICGSVPHLSSFFRRYKPNFSNVGSFFHLLFRSSGLRSKKSSDMPLHDVERISSNPSAMHKDQIETKVLGSIEGEGKFLKSGNFSRTWGNRISTGNSGSTPIFDDRGATKRDYYEIAEKKQSGTNAPVSGQEHSISTSHWSSNEPSPQEADFDTITQGMSSNEASQVFGGNMEEPFRVPNKRSAEEQNDTHRKDYWEILSLFRSSNNKSVN